MTFTYEFILCIFIFYKNGFIVCYFFFSTSLIGYFLHIILFIYFFHLFLLVCGPGWMHETSAWAWCTGKTQRDWVEREVGGGTGMGNT